MKTYSLVLLDLDGTLVDSNLRVSANTKKLLRRLEKRGIPIVLCSARAPGGVELVVKQVGLSSPIVCYSGSLILDADRSILADRGIGRDDAVSFKQFAALDFPNITVCSYMYDIWLADDASDPYIMMLAERNQCQAITGSLDDALKGTGHVHKMMCMGQPREIRRLQDAASRRFPAMEFVCSGDIFLEVLTKGVSKLTAMERLREHYHLDMEQVVAIGDYYVDIGMISRAGLGIAMGNAPDEVKQAAARTTASNDEEGVYLALKTLKFTPLLTGAEE